MSQTANDENSPAGTGWSNARNELFRMIMEGRSFSGRERNCCFLNQGDGSFATISAISGFDFEDDARCIAVTDWDCDGDQDLWISNRNAPRLRLLRNDFKTQNHFVSLQLIGNGRTTNRDAIGARVEIQLEGANPNEKRLVKTLRAGEGFLSQSSKFLHFGLGTATKTSRVIKIARVIVDWPGGARESFSGLEVNRRHRIEQGHGIGRLNNDFPRSIELRSATQLAQQETQTARVAMATLIDMPTLQYRSANGSESIESFDSGKPTFVNLWASWCGPCIKELQELSSAAEKFAAHDINVISLSVDTLNAEDKGESTAIRTAKETIDRIRYPHAWGMIDPEQADRIQQLHHRLFFLRQPLPLPVSFLIDEKGRLSVIYRGRVSVDQVIADSHRSTNGYQEAFEQATCLPNSGRAIDHPRIHEVARQTDLHTRYQVASWLDASGQFEDAIEHFSSIANIDPKWAVPLRHLTKLYLGQGKLQLALEAGNRALALDPKQSRTHNSLGLVHSQLGDRQRAEKFLRQAIRFDSKFAEAHNNLGSILAPQGKIAEAARHFKRAVELDANFAEAQTNLGSIYAGRGRFDLAMKHYRLAVVANPKFADAHRNIGSVYANQGNLPQAIRYYEQALRLNPNDSGTRANLDRAVKLLRQK